MDGMIGRTVRKINKNKRTYDDYEVPEAFGRIKFYKKNNFMKTNRSNAPIPILFPIQNKTIPHNTDYITLGKIFHSFAISLIQSVPTCVCSGLIQVLNAQTNAFLGYVSSIVNSFGAYTITNDITKSLNIIFPYGTETFSVTTTNGPYTGCYNPFFYAHKVSLQQVRIFLQLVSIIVI